uniref:Uncharacterized protein n=1 Tax=Malurus cyaneus samueli TaxID=2593467 RepID=A0A8C5TAJ1_9PASS
FTSEQPNRKLQTEAELERRQGKDQIKQGTRNPSVCPPKMMGAMWGKANACVQNKEPYYTKLDFKFTFSLLIIRIIHFFLDQTSTVHCIMSLPLLYNGKRKYRIIYSDIVYQHINLCCILSHFPYMALTILSFNMF